MLKYISFLFLILSSAQLYCLSDGNFSWMRGKPVYILDSNVNFREEPNLNSRILGRFNRDDTVILLDIVDNNGRQKIDDVESYWYKVQFNEIVGYVWGGYIADQRIVSEIDGNEIIFYTRKSVYSHLGIAYVIAEKDIFLYVNGRSINFGNVFSQIRERWTVCSSKTTNDGIHILFHDVNYEEYEKTIFNFYEFIINKSGEINYIGIKRMTYEEANTEYNIY